MSGGFPRGEGAASKLFVQFPSLYLGPCLGQFCWRDLLPGGPLAQLNANHVCDPSGPPAPEHCTLGTENGLGYNALGV